ncbi:MAG TPA: beta-propeller fold lactonase family protein [Gemmatimonadales bacterium]|nr:beta-propeller fold lactonase family protein [Gemmatimonadales bacterium]
MHNQIAVVALAAAALAACSPDHGGMGPRGAAAQAVKLEAGATSAVATDDAPGAVYTLMNLTATAGGGGNAVAMFTRAADGTLTAAGTVATGGTGTGSGLGSQGALALSDDGRWLFAVNAGSNDFSILRVSPTGLALIKRIASGGTQPISLTVHGNLLYVLNAGGRGNISGFALDNDGGATAIPGATRSLSGAAVGPAEVAFSPDGRWLAVTEKTTNKIDVYAVGSDGLATGPTPQASAGTTPFGFAFGLRNELLVSEAAGTASSYVLGANGILTVTSGAVATHQGAPCWLVVTNNGRFAYTANARSGTISGFAVGTDGSLTLLDAGGNTADVGPGNIDLATSINGRYLYQLRGSGPIVALRVERDGHLTVLGRVGNMPGAVAGLVAR